MTTEEIVTKILEKYPNQYDNQKVEVIKPSIEHLSPLVRKALESFLQNGQHVKLDLFGYSIEKLIQERGQTEIASYLSLDWIVKEPGKALSVLNKGTEGQPGVIR